MPPRRSASFQDAVAVECDEVDNLLSEPAEKKIEKVESTIFFDFFFVATSAYLLLLVLVQRTFALSQIV